MRRADALKTLKRLRASYPGQTISDETAEEYVIRLMRWSSDVGEKAVDAAVESSTWFPTIADLTKHASASMPGGEYQADIIEWLCEFRGITKEQARQILIRTYLENHPDDPQGPWKRHLEAFGVTA